MDGTAQNGRDGLFVSASRDDRAGDVIVKVANLSPTAREVRVELAGAAGAAKAGRAFVLAGPDLKAENSLDEPTRVAPQEREVAAGAGGLALTLAPNSLTVLRAPAAPR